MQVHLLFELLFPKSFFRASYWRMIERLVVFFIWLLEQG
jgi:hypothetical protein